jgi:hypothetical protein
MTVLKIQCLGSWGLLPLQRSRAKCLSADEGDKLLGGFSLVVESSQGLTAPLFVPHKEL